MTSKFTSLKAITESLGEHSAALVDMTNMSLGNLARGVQTGDFWREKWRHRIEALVLFAYFDLCLIINTAENQQMNHSTLSSQRKHLFWPVRVTLNGCLQHLFVKVAWGLRKWLSIVRVGGLVCPYVGTSKQSCALSAWTQPPTIISIRFSVNECKCVISVNLLVVTLTMTKKIQKKRWTAQRGTHRKMVGWTLGDRGYGKYGSQCLLVYTWHSSWD